MRCRLALFCSCVVLLLVLPASALAFPRWAVKDTAGHTHGTVDHEYTPGAQYSHYYGRCFSNAGKVVGDLNSGSGQPEGFVSFGKEMGPVPMRTVGSVYLTTFHTMTSNRIIGKAVRHGSRWRLRQLVKGTWKTRGSVSAACPGCLAVTALRLLLWR